MTPWRGRAHAQPLHRPWGVSFSSQRGSCPYKTQADGGRAAKSPRLPSRAICRAATGLAAAPERVAIAGEPGSETQVWDPTHSKASPTQRVRSLVQAKEAGKRGAVPLGGLRRLSRPPQPPQLLDILFSPLQEAAQAADAGPGSYPLSPALPPCSELSLAPGALAVMGGSCPAPCVQPCVTLSPSLSPSSHSSEQAAASPVSPHGDGSPPSSLPAPRSRARPHPAAPRAPVLSSGHCAGHRACRNPKCPGWDWKSRCHFHVPRGSEGVAAAQSGWRCRSRGQGSGSVSREDPLGSRGK